MGAGRPPVVDIEEVKEKARAYLDSEGYKTIADFCRKHWISRMHFFRLCEKDEELSYLREMIKLAREVHLEQGGLSGDLNASMAKFALSQLGWTEKQEVKQTNKNFNVSKDDADSVL